MALNWGSIQWTPNWNVMGLSSKRFSVLPSQPIGNEPRKRLVGKQKTDNIVINAGESTVVFVLLNVPLAVGFCILLVSGDPSFVLLRPLSVHWNVLLERGNKCQTSAATPPDPMCDSSTEFTTCQADYSSTSSTPVLISNITPRFWCFCQLLAIHFGSVWLFHKHLVSFGNGFRCCWHLSWC